VASGGRAGLCGEGDRMRVAWVGPHSGEEPPISGENGSGTVFFTGCSLGCVFCQNYQVSREGVGAALDAISEMLRQKGVLDVFESNGVLASKGVLVRHLILPGHVENSLDALTALFLEFGAGLPLSLMSQYCPVPGPLPENLKRRVEAEEFDRVYAHAMDLGFHRLFVQFPEVSDGGADSAPFLPDFRDARPFRGGPRSG